MSLVTTADLRSEEFFRELVIPALNEASVVLRSLRRIDTTATKVNLPIINDANVGWVAEGAALPDAGLTPSLVAVTPKKLSAYADLSNESVNDASSSAIVGAALAQALARKVDAAFFVSGGAAAPPSLAGATTMEAAGATPTVIFLNPSDWAVLAKIKEATGSAKPILVAQAGPTAATARALNGIPVEVSSGVPAGTGYMVDGTRTVAVVRQDGTVEADRSVGFRNDITVVRVIGRFGFGFLYSSAVVRIKDIP